MTILVRYAIDTYKAEGFIGLLKKIIRYISWTQIIGEVSWYIASSSVADQLSVSVEGRELCLHPNDPGLSKEVFIYGIHEPKATDLLKGFIHEKMIVVDVGANIGYYAMMEAALVGQQGHVYAIEPAPHNHELLQYNIRLNNIDNMTVLPPCAIGNVDAIGKLYLGDSANWHTLSKPSHNASSYMEIPVRKLDSLLGEISVQSVDFIRMDIEGYEVEAIKGMWSTLERSRPRLMIELHYDTAGVKGINELLGSLMSLNYQVEYILDRDLDLPSVEHKEVIKNIPINILMTGAPSYRVAMCFLVAKGER